MNPIVIFNGFTIDLEAGQTIAQTKQVNDLASLDDRQTNYTNRYKCADTANNRKAFEFLSLPGNSSPVPYQRNETYLYSSSGECFVYKGWATVTATSKGYDMYIYDGLIDLYKAIENSSLAGLGLTELNHTKELSTVIGSWSAISPYRYILGDYGGKLYYDTNKVNIDYLAPSVNTKWLWNKLFAFHGFTYSGSIFDTEDFTNSWLTYPKGVFSTIPDEIKFESDDADFASNGSPLQNFPNHKHSSFLNFLTASTNDLQATIGNRHFLPGETSLYRLEIAGNISPRRLHKSVWYVPNGEDTVTYSEHPQVIDLWLCKNQPGSNNANTIVPIQKLNDVPIGAYNSFNFFEVNINKLLQLDANDSFCVIARSSNPGTGSLGNLLRVNSENALTLSIKKVVQQQIAFDVALQEFSQRDFVKLVLTRFGLTAFKDKYDNHIEFLTMQERLQEPQIDNWSSKFIKVEGEAYTFGGYAQKNLFQYNYQDKESDYNDGALLVSNVNLQDKKVVLKSKIYSPEAELVDFLNRPTRTYKLWDKEITDNEEVKYKALDKRFYLLKSESIEFNPAIIIGSEELGTQQSVTSAPVESFFRMRWQDVLQDYYSPINAILDRSLAQNILLDLQDSDVINLNFKRLKFIEQESSYYLLNKLMNYVSGKPVKAEMIRVFFEPPPPPFIGLKINDITISLKPQGWLVRFSYLNTSGETGVIATTNGVESTIVDNQVFGNVHNAILGIFPGGNYDFFISTANFQSDTYSFALANIDGEIEP